MKLLALESSGNGCSVALYLDGQIQDKISDSAAQQHSRLLLPMQQALLDEAGLSLSNLDVMACSIGPGSFTGVRVSTALAQGLAYGANLPALGVSTLACMAHAARDKGYAQALVMLDARMNEIYWAHYQYQGEFTQVIQPESLAKPEELPALELQGCVGLGNGWASYSEALRPLADQCEAVDADARPTAALIAELAASQISSGLAAPQAASELQPLYVRNQVTTPPGPRK